VEQWAGIGSGLELEARVLLSARAAAMTNARQAHAIAARVTPAAEINAQYNAFVNDFTTVENLYVTSINEQSSSAASIFPSFIINRTNQMVIDLVRYFNSLPLKLPYFNTPPHTPNNRGAIQNYVYGSVAGGGTTSLATIAAGDPLADHDRFPPANLQRGGRVGHRAVAYPDLERGE